MVIETIRIAGSVMRSSNASGLAGGHEIHHRTGHAGPARIRPLLDHRREPILRHQRIAHGTVGSADAGADDRPVMVAARIEEPIQIDRLMAAMEVADTDMQDAAAEPVTRIARPVDPLRQSIQCC